VRGAAKPAGIFDEIDSPWLLLDAELLPWSAAEIRWPATGVPGSSPTGPGSSSPHSPGGEELLAGLPGKHGDQLLEIGWPNRGNVTDRARHESVDPGFPLSLVRGRALVWLR